MSAFNVFVYGTLKPGYANYDRYCRDRLLKAQRAMVKGQLYDLPVGYPGMIVGEQWVQGYLLTLTEDGKTLMDLDRLEDYQAHRSTNLYQREWITVFDLNGESLGEAWGYVMTQERIQAMQGVAIPSGSWSLKTGET